MNTVRALKEKSKKLAIIGFLVVLIIDMAKGAFAIFFARFLLPLDPWALVVASFFVVLGHNYSIFLKLAGGRGAACLIGILLYLDTFSFIVWGLPVVICTILAQIILEKTGFETKINWRKTSAIISTFGKQMAGRLAGLFFGPIAIYFYSPQIFLPIAVGTILLLIKNIPRFKVYFLGEKIDGD
jgi:glycerol-3-phosphate acyltransferase PlsY